VVFRDTVRLAKALGQVRQEHLAQDGSKILANASKHKAMSYERMAQTEARLGRDRGHPDGGAGDGRHGGIPKYVFHDQSSLLHSSSVVTARRHGRRPDG
jgi:hypothetical protein